jgi:23S rRNA-/tRNA-specific pseudouridylate synthase
VADLFSKHQIQKTYHCISWHHPGAAKKSTDDAFTVDDYLGKVSERNRKSVFGKVKSGGDHAVTDFRVIEAFREAYWIEAKPKTGRTHQIRVHTSEAGYPIFGDRLYFPEGVHSIYSAPRLMLHALKLEFVHPMTEKAIRIDAPLPETFVQFLTQFK